METTLKKYGSESKNLHAMVNKDATQCSSDKDRAICARPHSMKREQSQSDSIERDKKRVKFNPHHIELTKARSSKSVKDKVYAKPANYKGKGILKNKSVSLEEILDTKLRNSRLGDKQIDSNDETLHEECEELIPNAVATNYATGNEQQNTEGGYSYVAADIERNCPLDNADKKRLIEECNENIACDRELGEQLNTEGTYSYIAADIEANCASDKDNKRRLVEECNEDIACEEDLSTDSITLERQNTFTRQGLRSKACAELNIEKDKAGARDISLMSKSINSNECSSKLSKNDTKKPPLQLRKRSIRNNITPKESKCTPQIINAKDRRSFSFGLRRNLQNDKGNGFSTDGAGVGLVKEPQRKCLKICSDSQVHASRKESLSADMKSPVSESRDLRKALEEVQILKDQNKSLEETLKGQMCRERNLTVNQRVLKEKHEIENSRLVRESKKEATILLSELKSKERVVSNLQKELQKISSKTARKFEVENNSRNYSIPRPTLTRSVSAAGSIGRQSKPQIAKTHKSRKDETPTRALCAKKREEYIGKGTKPEKRRYISKLEQLRKQIEDQQREIASLNERLKGQNPNLQSLSQLSASVPTIYEADKSDGTPRSTSIEERASSVTKNESPMPKCNAPVQDDCLLRNKVAESEQNTMANVNEIMCKSLDLFGSRYSSLDYPPSLRYSSLVSLNGNRRESELTEENEMLRAELQETRDHAELLEFRILEFTEGIQGVTTGVHSTCDQSTNTSNDDVITSPQPISEDLSLPLSVDSGLELNIDISKSRLLDCRKSLARLEEASGLRESTCIAHLSSLIDLVSSINHYDQLPPVMSPRSPVQKKMGLATCLEERHLEDNICETDLTMLAAKLQETLANPKAQEAVLEETIIKLRSVNSALVRLQSRVNSLTVDNKELQEALTTLHDAHETRTEASGTESELVHGKTPSLHSDLSDSESDESSRPSKRGAIDTSTSFQESGIFESSCDMINAATQTSQESDEYLVAALEGEKVTLCKIEYDTIVATERNLQSEIEMLQFEKEQMASQCALLEEKLEKATNDDTFLVLRAQVRLLEERLQIADRHKRQYFDEKCEIEEAENDARLLSQRLESQLEAAREMESLLSASLSQEQEFCRELQRRVREMHDIERSRRLHEEVLEKESRFCRRREAALVIANESQKSQLTFALYGLILAQFWRRLASCNKDAIVPYSPHGLNFSPISLSAGLEKSLSASPEKSLSASSEKSLSASLEKSLSAGSKTVPILPTFPCVSKCQQCLSVNVPNTVRCGSDACTQTNLSRGDNFADAVSSKKQKLANDLNDREEYYLAQVERLQTERKGLREDYEQEQSLLLQQIDSLKDNLERLQESLDESQKEKCELLFRLDEAQAVIRGSEIELENQTKELRREFTKSADVYQRDRDVYQQERKAMQDQYEERVSEMRRNVEFHEQRFAALLQQYSILQHELGPYFQNMSSSIDEFGTDDGTTSGAKILTTKDLLSAVRELMRSESAVKQKVVDMEKKESAYRETINEADRIMSNHVKIYTRRIEELEANLEQKSQRIKQLETSEERLRSTMKNSWKSGEGSRITELLDRLIETENSELQLKERVWNLERNGKELQIKFSEAEKAQENLRGELRDQEEMVQRLMTLTSDNNALTSQLQEAHDASRRASDMQQSENYLKSRVDELEASENGLKEALKQTELIVMQRDRKFRDQVSNLEEEASTLRGQLDLRIHELKESKDVETSLRHQLENFKGQVHNLEKELKDSSSENICHETQYRSEVMKLRNQLKLANTQLTDLDTLNGEFKERLSVAEAAMKEVAMQLEERSRRHENDVLGLNLQMNQKDMKIEDYEAQLQHISHSNVAGEFEYLATSPLRNLKSTLNNLLENSKKCDECSNRHDSEYQTLSDCLRTLDDLINGRRNSQTDSESEDSESIQTENLANEHCTTSPPTPAQEGHNDCSSGEGETASVYSLALSQDSTPDGADSLHAGPDTPHAPPRLRRDAKKKKGRKSVRKEGSLLDELGESSSTGGSFYGALHLPSGTILDELEEKVRELEDVLAKKEEELRLADGEATELHIRLMEEDGKLSQKTEEANKSNEDVANLREQLLRTVQEYENVRVELESKHKVNMKELTQKVESLNAELLQLSQKANLKDKIIGTLVRQIRCILRSGSATVLANQIRKLGSGQQDINPGFGIQESRNPVLEDDITVLDFDVDTVCDLLEHPRDVLVETPSSPLEVSKYQSLPTYSSLDSAKAVKKSRSADADSSNRLIGGATLEDPSKSCSLSARNLPPLEQNKKSRIPRFRPLSGSSLKHDDYPLSKNVPSKPFTKLPKRQSSEVAEPKQELKPLAKVVPKQRPMAKVKPKTQIILREDSPSKFITDARKVKRMVTGLAPLNASVDCASAPEYKKQPKPPTPSCVPRPMELKITRRVGIDGAVIAWKPLEHDCVAGFQVIVGGRVVQQVRSPHRTKALVTGLPFPSPFTIGLVTIAEDGRCSTPTVVSYEKPNAYKPKLQHRISNPNIIRKHSLPTSL